MISCLSTQPSSAESGNDFLNYPRQPRKLSTAEIGSLGTNPPVWIGWFGWTWFADELEKSTKALLRTWMILVLTEDQVGFRGLQSLENS